MYIAIPPPIPVFSNPHQNRDRGPVTDGEVFFVLGILIVYVVLLVKLYRMTR